MSNYAYEAVNAAGNSFRGTIDVASQSEALQRIKDMGLFPTRVTERRRPIYRPAKARPKPLARLARTTIALPGSGVRPAVLAVFTRQLATLTEAGLPLLRGLRILEQQETNRTLKRVIGEIADTIEGGGTFSEALELHPEVFSRLYVNMVKAGETSGALDITLLRLAGFMEKAQKIKGKVKSAMFYPVAVLSVATIIMTVMMVFVVPRFQAVFVGLLDGRSMPAFTVFVLRLSDLIRHHALFVAGAGGVLTAAFAIALRTTSGRWAFDYFKLKMPVFGVVLRKAAIARFGRTLGTLLGSGVPVLQALTIVKPTTGNVVVGNLVERIHSSVKEGEQIATPMRASTVFPPMVVGMVDVGEQTGALPDMLMKVADIYDDEVDNAVNSMTSLLEPVLIVFLGIVVGSIVIAMFLPIIRVATDGFEPRDSNGTDG